MPGLDRVGQLLVIGGIVLVLTGAAIWFIARAFPNLSQFPGTIRIQGGGFTCVIPLLASIVLSIVLTIVLNIIGRFLR